MVAVVRREQSPRLPDPRTSLIGRETETAEVLAFLTRSDLPLVTLTGPGGVGKTRFAVHVARQAAPHFPGGVAYVPLAAIRDSSLVLPTIGRAVGVPETGDHRLLPRITRALADRTTLLLLDNFEHLLDAAPILARIVGDVPELTVLCTSRARLRLSFECVYPLAPLAVPDSGQTAGFDQFARSDAIQLFTTRAQTAKPDFRLTPTNADAVADVCRRLDGLPLAIELAAARSGTLTPAALRDRLDSRASQLTDAIHDLPERQQTMRDTVAWSYMLLTPNEQQFFRTIAVFSRGFTLDAATAVWDSVSTCPLDALAGISSLVDMSLLRMIEAEDGEPRYLLLETIREFGLERLGELHEWDAVHRAHADWCVAMAEAAEGHLLGSNQAKWLHRVSQERENLRTALRWSIERDSELCLRAASALWLFWFVTGHLTEGCTWLQRAVDAGTNAPTALLAKACNNLGNLIFELGRLSEAFYRRSLSLQRQTGDHSGIAGALNNLGMLAKVRGDYAGATELLQESLALRRTHGEKNGQSPTMNNLGDVAIALGDGDTARIWNEQALALSKEMGNIRRVAHSLHNLGIAYRCGGDDLAAVTCIKSSLKLFEDVRDSPGMATVLHSLGQIARCRRDIECAKDHYSQSLSLHRDVLDRRGLVMSLQGVALLADQLGDFETCARFLSLADMFRGELVIVMPPRDRTDIEAALSRSRAHLGDSVFEAVWTAASALGREQAIEDALAFLDEAVAAPETSLTPRELEVLGLLAASLPNQEIADRLFISVRTVKAHVTSILSKLDVSSRSAAVAYAHNNHLI